MSVETQPFLDQFAPNEMATAYKKLTARFVSSIQSLPSSGIPLPFEKMDLMLGKEFSEITSEIDLMNFELSYFGNADGEDLDRATFGLPLGRECWCDEIARKVVAYCVTHPDELILVS